MLDDTSPLDRLMTALGSDEPTLPGVVPPEPEQHRLAGMEREQAQPEAEAERTNGNAQLLREEDRTRPTPRPTLSMPGVDFYVGPVHPMETGGFDRLAWGAGRTALPEPTLPTPPQAVPDIAEGSPLDRLMAALTQPDNGPQPDPARRRQEQTAPAMEQPESQELHQGDPGTLSRLATETEQAREGAPETEGLTQAQDRLAEIMERLDPGHAEREAGRSDEQRAEQIEAQLQASQQGRDTHGIGRSF